MTFLLSQPATHCQLHLDTRSRPLSVCCRSSVRCRPTALLARSPLSPSPQRPFHPVRATLHADSPDAGRPEGEKPELKSVWKALRLGAGLCLAVGAFAALGYGIGSSALLATTGASQKGLALAIQGGWTGLSAGCLHTLAGPDHLAGLAPITLGQSQIAATTIGALWGFGHSSGQLLLGIAFIILKEKFHGLAPILSKWSGAVVGLTLIAIGVMGIYESLHEEPGNHLQGGAGEETRIGSPPNKGWTTYGMGFVHGLQPDSLVMILPALTLPTRLAAVTFITMFVFGTVVAMAGYSFAIGTASIAAKDKPWLAQNLPKIAGSVAIAIGLTVLMAGLGLDIPFLTA